MNNQSAEAILKDLLRCASVTPDDAGALDILQERLENLGFVVHRKVFSDENTPPIENLYARIGTTEPNLCFAGHTDVVPAGDLTSWRFGPFDAQVDDGELYGRGAVDMKGAIACFVAATASYLQENPNFSGSLSFLITGDEEGPAINGTTKLLHWLKQQGEKIDACLLGEPTNPNQLGDAIKIGRRGSISGDLTVHGIQGHAAYPHLADNPVRGMAAMLENLLIGQLDEGSERFQPSNLEVTSVDVGNPATNVIPAKATAKFNIRFNDNWTAASLKQEIERRCQTAAKHSQYRKFGNNETPSEVSYSIDWQAKPSPCFLTSDEKLISVLANAVEVVTGRRPELSTGGGTSDARFIKDYCPVAEFGLVGQTMHQINERVPLSDLIILTDIYRKFVEDYFKGS